MYYWITRYYCQFYCIEYLSSTVMIFVLSSWGNYLYHHCRSVGPFVLWVQITHSSCFATTSSSDGRSKSSFERLCRGVCGLDCSSSASSVSAVTRPFSITDIYSQVVYFHSYCDVSSAISLLLLQCSNQLRYAKWTPGSPCVSHHASSHLFCNVNFLCSLRTFKLFVEQGCRTDILCHLFLLVDVSGDWQRRVSHARWRSIWNLVLFWTPRYGANGMSELKLNLSSKQYMQPDHPTLSSFGRASTLSLGSIAFGSLVVTLLELLRIILNVAQNNANADGHRKIGLTTLTVFYIKPPFIQPSKLALLAVLRAS